MLDNIKVFKHVHVVLHQPKKQKKKKNVKKKENRKVNINTSTHISFFPLLTA